MLNRVREARESLKLTQRKLSQKAGISRTFISDIETGKKCPTIYVAELLAIALNTTKDDLFFTEEKNATHKKAREKQ